MAKPEIHKRQPGNNLPVLSQRRYGRGRRVQNPEDLPVGWEDLFEEWGAEGLSITEVRANLDIGKDLWAHWFRHWREFREVVERFLDLSEGWWLKFGRENLGNKFFNSGLYVTSMAMRFKYPRQLEHQLETIGNAQDTGAIEKEEDLRLADLFSGGDGSVKVNTAPDPREPVAVDAEWMDSVDMRKKPK